MRYVASIDLLQASGSFFFRSKAMREHKCNQGGRKPVDLFSILKYNQVFSSILKIKVVSTKLSPCTMVVIVTIHTGRCLANLPQKRQTAEKLIKVKVK